MARSPPLRVFRLNFVQYRKDCLLRLLFQAVGHLRPAQRVRFAVRHLGGLHQRVQGLVHHLLCCPSDSIAARQQRALQRHGCIVGRSVPDIPDAASRSGSGTGSAGSAGKGSESGSLRGSSCTS